MQQHTRTSTQLFSAAPLVAGLGGLIERIGDAANSTLTAKVQLPDGTTKKWLDKTPITNHTSALEKLIRFLGDNVSSTIEQEVGATDGQSQGREASIRQQQLLDALQTCAPRPHHNPNHPRCLLWATASCMDWTLPRRCSWMMR